jgi:CBS domain-containing protein
MNKRGGAFGFLASLLGKRKSIINYYLELNSIRVKDIMIKDVLCIHRDDKLTEAAHTMIGAHASCLVVLDNYKPAGIITERDFVKKLGMAKDHSEAMVVNDIMTKKLFSATPNMTLFEVHKMMRAHNFRKIVVIENNELKGIITQTDLCKSVANLRASHPHPPLVEDFMSKKVLTVAGEDTFIKAKKLMTAKDIGSVLIIEKGEVKGMFTEFDLVSEFFMNPNRLKNSRMKELMTTPVMCISPGFDLFQINDLMLEHNFRRLPVVKGNKIIGIITQTDVARGLYDFILGHKDYDGETRPETNEPSYCTKKTNNLIVCEKNPEQPELAEAIKQEKPRKK